MNGRPLQPESNFHFGPYASASFARRREILRETLSAFQARPRYYHSLAQKNIDRWNAPAKTPAIADLRVLSGDWGAVTLKLTKQYGRIFAALNMANAYVPGGGYIEGCPAQEENMFRRTDCHFALDQTKMDSSRERYLPAESALLNAENGKVYLDSQAFRVCIRGPEDRSQKDLGYSWLSEDEIFPFYELRAAAMDLRGGAPFSPQKSMNRIQAQLATLSAHGIRHVVLSAFGCGAFQNPADKVASLYREAVEQRRSDFDCIAFAIFDPGYGPDNFSTFQNVFSS